MNTDYNVEDTVVNISKNKLSNLEAHNKMLKKKIDLYEKSLKQSRDIIHKENLKKTRKENILEYLESQIILMEINNNMNEQEFAYEIKNIVKYLEGISDKYLTKYE